jgi:hypothetical protein
MKGAMSGVVEVLDREGQVRAVFKIGQGPARIGRSPACEVVLDDAHLAGEHAELVWTEQGPSLVLLPSLNGGWLGERRLAAGEAVPLAGTAQFLLGATQMRWRSADAPLAPELPLTAHEQHPAPRGVLWLPVLMALFLFMLAGEHWLAVDPGARWVDYAGPVLGPLAFVLAWAAVWSLVTQLFQRRFPFSKHLRRVLAWCCVIAALSYGVPLLAYAFSWARLMAVDALVYPVGIVLLLWWHASLVWPRARRGMAVGLGCMLVLGLGLQMASRTEQQHWFGPAYLSALPPPQLRVVAPKPTPALIEELRPLQAELSRMAKKDKDGQEAGADEE